MTTTGQETAPELLKTDCLRRVRTSLTRREAILDEFERSGGSGAQFAALLGIKYSTFASWIQGRRRARRWSEGEAETASSVLRCGQTAEAPVWLEAVLEKGPSPAVNLGLAATSAKSSAESAGQGVRIQLPGGAAVEVTHQRQIGLLAALLRELENKGATPC
jgi:hypothetical protein